jgi:hypothetical protein
MEMVIRFRLRLIRISLFILGVASSFARVTKTSAFPVSEVAMDDLGIIREYAKGYFCL